MNGWYTKKNAAGGTTWGHEYQFSPGQANIPLELWDVDFLTEFDGWLVTRHMVYRTTSGGGNEDAWSTLDFFNGTHQLTPEELADLNFYALDILPVSALPNPPPPPATVVAILVAEPGLIFRSLDGIVFEQVFDITSKCGTTTLATCMSAICASQPPPVGFEFWDVELSRNPSTPLALAVGGLDSGCGMVFASTDHGATWTSEPHECTCSGLQGCFNCNGLPEYTEDTEIDTETVRFKSFHTLYSVSIFDGDNTAIAGGYGGQHVYRPVTGIWRDRSRSSGDLVHAVGAVTTPMYGTVAGTGTSATGKGLIMGAGGFIRRTTTGGEAWVTEVSGDPWRIRDAYFTNETTGFVVGQMFRIAKTVESGESWNHVIPEPVQGGRNLLAITFNSLGSKGVAVGEPNNEPGRLFDRPKIMVTNDQFGEVWVSPMNLLDIPGTISTERSLLAVEWSGGEEFWTAGEGGLIYRTTDNGVNWSQWVPPGQTWSQISDFEIHGVAFRDVSTGIFVGNRASGPAAYLYQNIGGNQTWTDITPVSTSGVVALYDVDIRGDVAYAVGDKIAGVRQGEVFTSVSSGAGFGQFTAVPHVDPFSRCSVGDDLGVVPALNTVEIASDNRVWMAGECGRVWSYDAGTWTEHKSQTDAHVRGISFPTATDGYLGCFRTGRAGWSVVKYEPPPP